VRRVGGGNEAARVVADGVEQPDKRVALSDDRRDHHADVAVGGPATSSGNRHSSGAGLGLLGLDLPGDITAPAR
jgi:hypothetical protein